MEVSVYRVADQYGRDQEWIEDVPVSLAGCAKTTLRDAEPGDYFQALPSAQSDRFDECSIWGAGRENFEYTGSAVELEFTLKWNKGCEPN